MMALAAAATLALAACAGMTPQERMVVGGLAGATTGLIVADALNANRNWTIIAALAGATAGTLVARNSATGECAYSNGDGTYRVGPCPA
jgi:hypothetical protein